MPTIEIVGTKQRVVETSMLSIDELAGNVATKDDRISIAHVQAKAGTSEPWLTLHYDEWICVMKGAMKLEQEGIAPIIVPAGSTVLIHEGTRFRPSFEVDTEYVPVCLPAFRPDRCIREDSNEEGAGIAQKLQKLHGSSDVGTSRASGAETATKAANRIEIVGGKQRVVDTGMLSIDELAGNVATKDDRISIAHVQAKAGTSEPWLTLHYDEWICVMKGAMKLEQDGVAPIVVPAGSTVLVHKGTRFRPSFEVDTEYVPVCLPAFRPDRCIREDTNEQDSGIAQKLQKLHGSSDVGTSRAGGAETAIKAANRIEIVGTKQRVVDTGSMSIDELAGNAATNDDRISIAHVKASAATVEPWLTLHYDEWICVMKGSVKLEQEGTAPIVVPAGSTVLIPKGTRFKPSFEADTEFVPVCLPAFRPDRCIREDTNEEGTEVAQNLKKVHNTTDAGYCKAGGEDAKPEVLYHMTTKAEWKAAQIEGVYYPKSYEVDGHYTHATGVPSRLITTANHFYQDVEGDWICVEFTRTALRKCGIHVRDEEAMPVGDKPVGADWGSWVCPHIIGGIPTHIIDHEYKMTRDGPRFTGIADLEAVNA